MNRRAFAIVVTTVLVLMLAACSPEGTTTSTATGSDSTNGLDPMAVPAEVSALVDEWYAANERQDGSVLELYVPEGYHLYGDQRIEHDELPDHFTHSGWTHEWTTPAVLITDEGDGRFVVARGARNTSPAGQSWASALLFEIVTTPGPSPRR